MKTRQVVRWRKRKALLAARFPREVRPSGGGAGWWLAALTLIALALMFAGCGGVVEVDTSTAAEGAAAVPGCDDLPCSTTMTEWGGGCLCACGADAGSVLGAWAPLPLTPDVLTSWAGCLASICAGSICGGAP